MEHHFGLASMEHHFDPDISKMARRLERLQLKIFNKKQSAVFNETYIYIYVCVCVCVHASMRVYVCVCVHIFRRRERQLSGRSFSVVRFCYLFGYLNWLALRIEHPGVMDNVLYCVLEVFEFRLQWRYCHLIQLNKVIEYSCWLISITVVPLYSFDFGIK